MQDIAYKQKYLKYKAKYLELKKGGGKKITFKSLKDKFLALKELYWRIYKNNSSGFGQTTLYKKIKKIEEDASRKELIITYEDENMLYKEGSEYVNSMAMLPAMVSTPTFFLNIKVRNIKLPDGKEVVISVLEKCSEDTCENT
jgi:hypothetical protein